MAKVDCMFYLGSKSQCTHFIHCIFHSIRKQSTFSSIYVIYYSGQLAQFINTLQKETRNNKVMFKKLYNSLFIFFMKLTPGKSFGLHVVGSYAMIGVYSLFLSSFTTTCGWFDLINFWSHPSPLEPIVDGSFDPRDAHTKICKLYRDIEHSQNLFGIYYPSFPPPPPFEETLVYLKNVSNGTFLPGPNVLEIYISESARVVDFHKTAKLNLYTTLSRGMYPLSSSQGTGMVPFDSVETELDRKEGRLKEISSILKDVHQQLIEIQPVIVDCFNSKKYSDYIHSAHYTRIYESSLLHNMKAENMSSLPRLDFSQMPQRIEPTCYITNGSDSLMFPVTHNLASEVNLTGGLSPQTLAVLNST